MPAWRSRLNKTNIYKILTVKTQRLNLAVLPNQHKLAGVLTEEAPREGILTGFQPELPQAAVSVRELPVLASDDLLLLRGWGTNTSQTPSA